MRFGVAVFPGSNCDADTEYALGTVLGAEVRQLWHADDTVDGVDCVVVPGGFAYGDYLRAGAIARFAPVMRAVQRHAEAGGLVLGICNGFQVLVEAGLLPGALLRNDALEFRCRWVGLRVERADTPFTNRYGVSETIRMPIAHGEGRYYADATTVAALEANRQVVLRYAPLPERAGDPWPANDQCGATTGSAGFQPAPGRASGPAGSPSSQPHLGHILPDDSANPNGSVGDIAGLVNQRGNVFGLMPHPERCCEALVGGADGLRLFQSIVRFGAAPSQRPHADHPASGDTLQRSAHVG